MRPAPLAATAALEATAALQVRSQATAVPAAWAATEPPVARAALVSAVRSAGTPVRRARPAAMAAMAAPAAWAAMAASVAPPRMAPRAQPAVVAMAASAATPVRQATAAPAATAMRPRPTAARAGTAAIPVRLALAARFPEAMDAVMQRAQDPRADRLRIEREVFGTDHVAVGREVALRWRFPHAVADAIAAHHAPVPGPDGGHMVMYAWEGLTRRKIPVRVKEWSLRVGVALLMGLMVFAMFNDITRYISIFRNG